MIKYLRKNLNKKPKATGRIRPIMESVKSNYADIKTHFYNFDLPGQVRDNIRNMESAAQRFSFFKLKFKH